MGHFNHSILLASHKCSFLLGGGALIHQIPWCLLCLPLAATICFSTADLWTASRHAVIFPSDSTEKGKHINYSSLGAAFIYSARNEIFLCVSLVLFCFYKDTVEQFCLLHKGQCWGAWLIKLHGIKSFQHKVPGLYMPWESQGRSSTLLLHTLCVILLF